MPTIPFPLLVLVLCLTIGSVGAEDPRRAATYNEAGIAAFEAGDYAKAVREFQRALELRPSSADIRTNLGKAHAAAGVVLLESAASGRGGTAESRRALEQLNLALVYWRGDVDTHHARGWCHLHLREYAAAAEALRKATELDSDSFKSWHLLGVVHEREHRLEKAVEVFERAHALRPGDARLGIRLRRLRCDIEAERDYTALDGKGFRLLYPPSLDRERAKEIHSTLVATADEFSRRWGKKPPPKVTAICYPPGEFSARTGLHEEVGGAFDGRIRLAFPEELESGGLGIDQVVKHETIHLMLHQLGDPPPRWLDEGLAQYLDGESRSGWAGQWRRLVRKAPNVGIEDRARQFEQERSETWSVLYLHSFFFVQHLVERGGEFRLDMMVREVGGGKTWAAAFESVYGKTVAEMDRDYRYSLIEESKQGFRAPGRSVDDEDVKHSHPVHCDHRTEGAPWPTPSPVTSSSS